MQKSQRQHRDFPEKDQSGPVGPSLTIAEFCAKHRISRALLYKLRKAGTGPRMSKVGERVIITAEAEAQYIGSL